MGWLFGKPKRSEATRAPQPAPAAGASANRSTAAAQQVRSGAPSSAQAADKYRQQEQQLLEWRLGVEAYRAAFRELARRLDVSDEEVRRIYCEHVSEVAAARPELRQTRVFKDALDCAAQP